MFHVRGRILSFSFDSRPKNAFAALTVKDVRLALVNALSRNRRRGIGKSGRRRRPNGRNGSIVIRNNFETVKSRRMIRMNFERQNFVLRSGNSGFRNRIFCFRRDHPADAVTGLRWSQLWAPISTVFILSMENQRHGGTWYLRLNQTCVIRRVKCRR